MAGFWIFLGLVLLACGIPKEITIRVYHTKFPDYESDK